MFTARYESNLYVQFGLFTAETCIRSEVSVCEICGGQSGTVIIFSPSSYVFPPVSIILPPPHSHLHLHVALVRRTKEGILGIPKSPALWGVEDYCSEKSTYNLLNKKLMFRRLVFMTVRASNVGCHCIH